MTTYYSLQNRHDRDPFLKQIVTGDEKWVLYDNPKSRCQWLMKGQELSKNYKTRISSTEGSSKYLVGLLRNYIVTILDTYTNDNTFSTNDN